jgi:hypothetical protein
MPTGIYTRSTLVGQRFSRLVVVAESERRSASGERYWLCRCDCGAAVEVVGTSLKSGNTKACGCLNRELIASRKPNIRHGATKTRLYRIFKLMHERCRAPRCRAFKNYGGRGICVCDEWATFEPFRDWAMANGYTDALTIDRIDNDGNYEPSNCRWATQKQQCRNKRNTIYLEHDGLKLTLKEWAEQTGLNYHTMFYRRQASPLSERVLRPARHGGKRV